MKKEGLIMNIKRLDTGIRFDLGIDRTGAFTKWEGSDKTKYSFEKSGEIADIVTALINKLSES